MPISNKDWFASNMEPVEKNNWFDLNMEPVDREIDAEKPESFKDKFLGGVEKAAQFVDKYTGAPVRSLVGKGLGVQMPLNEEGRGELERLNIRPGTPEAKDAIEKLSLNREVPSGKDIASQGLGLSTSVAPLSQEMIDFIKKSPELSDEKRRELLETYRTSSRVSPAGMVGAGLDVALDWTNVLPVGMAAKVGGKIGGKVAKASIEGIGKLGGEKTEAITKGITKTIEDVGKKAANVIDPQVAAKADETINIANKYGIDPESLSPQAKFGEFSEPSNIWKYEAEGPGGEPLRVKHNETAKKIQDTLENRIYKGNEPLSNVEAGEITREAYNKNIEDFFNSHEFTYNKVAGAYKTAQLNKYAQKDILSEIGKVRQEAASVIKDPSFKGKTLLEAKKMIDQLNSLENTVVRGTLPEVSQKMQDIGKLAYVSPRTLKDAEIPFSEKELSKLYREMREGFYKTVNEIDPNTGMELKVSNEEFQKFFNNNKQLRSALKKNAGEDIFKQVIQNGSSTEIRALKESLAGQPEVLDQLKSAYLNEILKDVTNIEEGMSFQKFFNKLNQRNNRVILDELFEPGELDEINEILKLGIRHGQPILNPSKTSVALRYGTSIKKQLLKKLPRNIQYEAGKAKSIYPSKPTSYVERLTTKRTPLEYIQKLLQMKADKDKK